MAASSGIVFAEALLRRDGRVSAQPGAWYPEEVLSLNRVEASLRRAGIDVTKTDRPRSGGLSPRPLTKKGACSRLAQSPPASPPNPDGLGLSRSAAQARKRASGRPPPGQARRGQPHRGRRPGARTQPPLLTGLWTRCYPAPCWAPAMSCLVARIMRAATIRAISMIAAAASNPRENPADSA